MANLRHKALCVEQPLPVVSPLAVHLPDHLYPAFQWIDSASEWADALSDPLYPLRAYQNAVEHEQVDVTESELRDVIEWYREHGSA